MSRATCLLVFLVVLVPSSPAQPTTSARPGFDLAKIGFIVNGRQVCEDKGRLQDYPSKVMDQIIGAGTESVPILIHMITDLRAIKTKEPIICYWYGMTVGDAALCVLSDLFTDANDKETIPNSSLASMMDPKDKDRPVSDQLHLFAQRHGRAVLQGKWRKLWSRYANRVYWDGNGKCFRLKEQ
jgi:hypothetical protein